MPKRPREEPAPAVRALDGAAHGDDAQFDRTLRPRTFDDYIGQTKHKENLRVFVEAAKRRGEPLDHILLCGPPGLGKTTLAHILAHEMGVQLMSTSGPVIEHKGALAALLTTKLQRHDILFIDEIHRLNPVVEESLYPAMDDLSHRRHDRRGGLRQRDADPPPALHPRRRDDPHRPAHRAAVLALRSRRAARLLPARRSRRASWRAARRLLGVEVARGRRTRDRPPLARDAARRQPAAPTRSATSPRCSGTGAIDEASGPPGLRSPRGRRRGARRDGPAATSTSSSTTTTAVPSASTRSPPPWRAARHPRGRRTSRS